MPTVDFNDMDSGQSDIRNKILTPVFKRLGIIEQWGNGLRLVAKEMQSYPEIELSWKEPGIAFRVTFTCKNFQQQKELQKELQHELQKETLYSKVLRLVIQKTSSTKELSVALGQKSISGQLKKVVSKLRKDKLVEWTEPDTEQSSNQKYRITEKGNLFLKLLNREPE